MNLQRRGFLAGLGLALAAPAVVKISSLMPIAPKIILWGDGQHDDTAALQALIDGRPVYGPSMQALPLMRGAVLLPNGIYSVSSPLMLRSNTRVEGSTFLLEDQEYAFDATGAENVAIIGNHIITKPGSPLHGRVIL